MESDCTHHHIGVLKSQSTLHWKVEVVWGKLRERKDTEEEVKKENERLSIYFYF